MAERLIATRMLGRLARQPAQAVAAARKVRSLSIAVAPPSVISDRNTSVGMIPCCGLFQRTSASAQTIRPAPSDNCGWKPNVTSFSANTRVKSASVTLTRLSGREVLSRLAGLASNAWRSG